MEYGTLDSFVQLDIGEGKSFYVSAYYHRGVRHTPTANTKPTRVTMVKNDPNNRYTVGIYASDRRCLNLLPKNDNGKVVSVSQYVYVFDTYEEAAGWYNERINEVITKYHDKIEKIRGHLIDGY